MHCTALYPALPFPSLPCPTLPYLTLPYPNPTLPCLIIPHPTLLYLLYPIPYLAVLSPCLSLLYLVLPHLTALAGSNEESGKGSGQESSQGRRGGSCRQDAVPRERHRRRLRVHVSHRQFLAEMFKSWRTPAGFPAARLLPAPGESVPVSVAVVDALVRGVLSTSPFSALSFSESRPLIGSLSSTPDSPLSSEGFIPLRQIIDYHFMV